ncbi:MAG: hypothetical protein JRD04_13165 [Deltaproteobacteria bacterium]|nr:hypothetical protein [Deltaproteobacteria bacterium]
MRKIKRCVSVCFCLFGFLPFAFAEFSYEFWAGPGKQFFPSLAAISQTILPGADVSPYQIGDPSGVVGIEIKTDEKLKGVLTVSSSSLVRSSTLHFELSPSTNTYNVAPFIDYDMKALYEARQPCPELFEFVLQIEGQPEIKERQKVLVRSLNDCPYYLKDGDQITSLRPLFAAFVNEHHPVVDEILHKALDTKIVSSFSGYQGSAAEVGEEIFAVWNALQREGVQYSSVTTPSGYSKEVRSQHVRFVQDSYKNAQANCVDGSVLLASVFTKIGLEVALLFPRGHCVLVVYIEDPSKKKNADFYCLETTLIGSVDVNKYSLERGLNHLASARKNNLSRGSFNQAVRVGAQKYNAMKTVVGENLIPISMAREGGIIPLSDGFADKWYESR